MRAVAGDRGSGEARADSRSRRGARGAGRRRGRAARARRDWRSMRSVRYGWRRTRSHSPAPSGPRLVPGSRSRRRAGRGRARARRGAAARTSASGSPSRARRLRGELGDRTRVPRKYGDFRSTKSAIASERGVEALARRARPRARARRRSPRPSSPTVVEARRGCTLGLGLDEVGQRGSNCSPRRSRASCLAAARRRPCGSRPRRTPRPARCGRRAGPRSPSQLARPAAAVPALVGGAERLERPSSGSSSCSRQRPRDRGVVRDHAVDLAVPGERELEAEPEAVQRRAARSRGTACPSPPSAGCAARGRT